MVFKVKAGIGKTAGGREFNQAHVRVLDFTHKCHNSRDRFDKMEWI